MKEDWLALLMSAENKAGNDAGTVAALQQLIAVNPTDAYWKNLIQYAQRATKDAPNATKTAARYLFHQAAGRHPDHRAGLHRHSPACPAGRSAGFGPKTIVDNGFKAILGQGA